MKRNLDLCKIHNSHTKIIFTEESLKDIKAVEWTPEIAYKAYHNDKLEDLPTAILEDMIKYINSIIEKKMNNESEE